MKLKLEKMEQSPQTYQADVVDVWPKNSSHIYQTVLQ